MNPKSIGNVKWAYLLALLLALFSGIGNMPMYGRYYVADIPGFGWSRNFFVNIHLHYLAGAVLLGLSTFLTIIYLNRRFKPIRLSSSGAIRVCLLGGVLASGVLAAIKNLSAVNLPMAGLMTVAFVHLGSSMAAIFCLLIFGLLKKPWVIDTSRR